MGWKVGRCVYKSVSVTFILGKKTARRYLTLAVLRNIECRSGLWEGLEVWLVVDEAEFEGVRIVLTKAL